MEDNFIDFDRASVESNDGADEDNGRGQRDDTDGRVSMLPREPEEYASTFSESTELARLQKQIERCVSVAGNYTFGAPQLH
jgi:hypothetical protein